MSYNYNEEKDEKGVESVDVYSASVDNRLREVAADEYYELPASVKSRSLIWSVLSLVLSVLSVALFIFYPAAIVLSAVGVALSMVARYRLGFFDRLSLFGLIIGIIGFMLGLFSLIATVSGVFAMLFGW